MGTSDRALEVKWQGIIGRLPQGFFVQVEEGLLVIGFMGRGFQEILEPGGQRPQGYARVYSFDINSISAQDRAEIIPKIRKAIQRALVQTGKIPKNLVPSET